VVTLVPHITPTATLSLIILGTTRNRSITMYDQRTRTRTHNTTIARASDGRVTQPPVTTRTSNLAC
jgi:hypothetical protein